MCVFLAAPRRVICDVCLSVFRESVLESVKKCKLAL